MLVMAFLAITAYWTLPSLGVRVSSEVGMVLYLLHWAAVGGLGGFGMSKGDRGSAPGAILGALLATFLMC